MDEILQLYEHFKEFVYTFEMVLDNNYNELHIKYGWWQYDLLDVDLDWDEEYYDHMMQHFNGMLISCVKNTLKQSQVTKATLSKYHMIFRNIEELEYKKHFSIVTNQQGKQQLHETTTIVETLS